MRYNVIILSNSLYDFYIINVSIKYSVNYSHDLR